MRMWMAEPLLLCGKHLGGEHFEFHKFRHSFEDKEDMRKRIARRQIFPHHMQERHDAIAEEMRRRGGNHKSPYVQPDVSHLPKIDVEIYDLERNYLELFIKCTKCRERIIKYIKGELR